MKKTFQAADLGHAQADAVNSAKAYKAAQTAAFKALEALKKG